MTKAPALQLYERGFTKLVSVIPPGVSLSPGSRISPSQLGKSPGRRLANGTWVGYDYLNLHPTEETVRKWVKDGANIGLLAEDFPALDVDSMDEWLVEQVTQLAFAQLGPAPMRTGKPPKVLLPYRLEGEPFARMAVTVQRDGVSSLIEFLGSRRQYLVCGQHPSGRQYTWAGVPLWEMEPAQLAPLTYEKANAFLDMLVDVFGALPGVEVTRVGDGRLNKSADVAQEHLLAPSFESLQEAVRMIPNTDEHFPDRTDYIRMGTAIRASWPDEEEAFTVFAEWAAKHEADGRVAGNPETPREDWRRMRPPFRVGWSWLAEMARRFGFNDAALEFTKIDAEPVSELPIEAQQGKSSGQVIDSDEWLVDLVIEESGDLMRYVPATQTWYCWDGSRWRKDAINLAEQMIRGTLRRLGEQCGRVGGGDKEKQAAMRRAQYLTRAERMTSVRKLLQSDSRITMRPEDFDADPSLLNTPQGTVDLRTGALRRPDHRILVSKQTAVAPDASMPCPVWKKFLSEVTGGDVALEGFLQRLAGYAATGSTKEHKFIWMWGSGGNGKGTFFTAITSILADYYVRAATDLFTANPNDKHPAGIAALHGARLVLANETTEGRSLNEALLKELTGGDPISARLMRQDYTTFNPQFLLCFTSNHRPDLRDLGLAMKRRLLMVPFVFTPPVPDGDLKRKLEAEYPAILAWIIEGALMWQRDGLMPPPIIVEATQEYFAENDSVACFIEDCLPPEDGSTAKIGAVYDTYRAWAHDHGEKVMTEKRLLNTLLGRGLLRGRGAQSRELLHVKLKAAPVEAL